MLFGGLGGSELIFIATIVLLLVAVTRLTGFRRAPATEGTRKPVERGPSRAYIDRLLGRAQGRLPADERPVTGAGQDAGVAGKRAAP